MRSCLYKKWTGCPIGFLQLDKLTISRLGTGLKRVEFHFFLQVDSYPEWSFNSQIIDTVFANSHSWTLHVRNIGSSFVTLESKFIREYCKTIIISQFLGGLGSSSYVCVWLRFRLQLFVRHETLPQLIAYRWW